MTRRHGFTFAEILVALAVISFGILPLLWALHGGTRQTRISLRQVQAANHASNLIEAMRAFGFRKTQALPATKVQLRGNENKWQDYTSGMDLDLEELTEPPPTSSDPEAGIRLAGEAPPGDPALFAEFEDRFFGADNPVVPPLEDNFTRYFHLVKSPGGQYVTVIVRVEWPARLVSRSTNATKVVKRHVELRTVLADPYRGGS